MQLIFRIISICNKIRKKDGKDKNESYPHSYPQYPLKSKLKM